MKKIIAMDLDGTLLKDNKECPKDTKKYLQKLLYYNGKFFNIFKTKRCCFK